MQIFGIQLEVFLRYVGIAFTVAGTIFSVVYGLRKLAQQARASRGQFLLELMRDFGTHKEVIQNLRPSGKWGSTHEASLPRSAEEWQSIERYMAFYETAYVLMKTGLMDKPTFTRLFRGPLQNLVKHTEILSYKLSPSELIFWKSFVSLAREVGFKEYVSAALERGSSRNISSMPQAGGSELPATIRMLMKDGGINDSSVFHDFISALKLHETNVLYLLKRDPKNLALLIEKVCNAKAFKLSVSDEFVLNLIAEIHAFANRDPEEKIPSDLMNSIAGKVGSMLPPVSQLERSWLEGLNSTRVAELLIAAKIDDPMKLVSPVLKRPIYWTMRSEFRRELEVLFLRKVAINWDQNRDSNWLVKLAKEYFGRDFDAWFRENTTTHYDQLVAEARRSDQIDRAIRLAHEAARNGTLNAEVVPAIIQALIYKQERYEPVSRPDSFPEPQDIDWIALKASKA